jgi:hypothetical protein
MQSKDRTTLGAGLFLILLGIALLAFQFVSELDEWFKSIFDWPLIIVGVGVFLLFLGLLVGEPGMAVPACILGGIGGLLYYQNATGNYESWAYAWTLLPGFTGVGVMLAALLGHGRKGSFSSGFTLVFISIVMFHIFAAFSGVRPLGNYWPVLLIALGLWLIFKSFFKKRNAEN